MPLTLRVKAGQAVFSMADGAMKAEWTLTTGMDEEQLVDALVGMLRYVKKEGLAAPERHLHAVADRVEEQLPRSLGAGHDAPPELSAMSWKPVVQPKPLDASISQAAASGFEPIPPEEMED